MADDKFPKKPTQQTGGKASLRTRIQESIDHAHAEHKRELFQRRIDLARRGVRDYSLKRMADAVKAFEMYLRILEEWKGVPEGGLHPGVFDLKKETPELILISGVYWDLAKLYDRTKSRDKEFRHYLQKYVLFIKGMPYQALGTETLRKYIGNEKPVHREEFKNAYKTITGSNCFVATALLDVTDEKTIVRLRYFRDIVLAKSAAGRTFTEYYEKYGPYLALLTDKLPASVRKIIGKLLDLSSSIVWRLAQKRTNAAWPKN
ncbi:MAG: hypothetical protein A3K03_10730 [Bdellovibrionales bacterium RIFOXYD1_FULL_44_7]|nr:MAG: hypothetical protein A3K03_10730 [Bdellovibrionales bacterium RIFOXYD1_FULL_44_7]